MMQFRKSLKIFLLALCGLIFVLAIPVLSAEKPSQAQQLVEKGQTFYEAGKLDRAIKTWQSAATAYEAQGETEKQIASLLNIATAQQGLGLYDNSCKSVLQAYAITNTNCLDILDEVRPLERELQSSEKVKKDTVNPALSSLQPLIDSQPSLNKAIALLRMGDFFRQKDYPQAASKTMGLSLETARAINNKSQESAALLSLGNTYRQFAQQQQNQFTPQTIALDVIANREADPEAALAPYQDAFRYYIETATKAESPLSRVKAELNHLSLLLDTWEFWQSATSSLSNNLERSGITDPSFREEVKIGAVSLQLGISQQLQPQIISQTQQIQTELNQLPLSRGGVFAKINFAESLIRQNQLDGKTAQILALAITEAQKINNVSAEAEATGYLGNLYERQQQYPEAQKLTEKALELAPTIEYPEIAYRWHAQLGRILAQESDRPGALSAYEASFNTIRALRNDLATTPVEPIFRNYITLLLQEKSTPEELNQARNVLESLQISELDNFFRDPCSDVANAPVIIDNVDQKAAVIYPIILDKSLEVILTVPGQPIQRYSTAITPQEVDNKISQLRESALSDPRFAEAFRGARGNPQQEQEVQKSQQEALQEDILPLAQEIYNWLIKPAETSFEANDIETLVFVLDGSLRSIPMALLHDGKQYLIQKDYNIALTSGLQLTNPRPLQRQEIKVLAAGTTTDFPDYNFPAIPQVKTELNEIKSIFNNSEILLDEEFTQESLQQKLTEADYPVVHLATHGQFGSTSDQTFILSGGKSKSDRLINVKQLDRLLRTRNLRRSPIELLVLSACNTAKGDDQAILGLAGVAVRAGAQSTIATLWGANDEATAELMGYFYRNLADNAEISKAKALRQAQLDLIKAENSAYSHPYYWAPFVLIGNWL
jgi:CHAT domain-containing protein